jgi:hypothetical protein
MRLPILLALASGTAIGWTLYSDGYFPQNDVFLTYQIFHYVYSSIFLDGQVPLWQPYTSYGLPNDYEMVFTFTPANALLTLLGVLLRISDIKLLYFAAVGLNFAMIGVAAAYLTRELSGSDGAHVAFAAVAMPLSEYMETQPIGYQFALTFLFTLLFLAHFLKTRQGVYLFAAGLAVVANLYGQGQYMAFPEFYLAMLFALMAGVRYRGILAAEWRLILRSLLTAPALAVATLTALLLAGLLVIDREALETLGFTARMRDAQTLAPSLDAYLHFLYSPPFNRLVDVIGGRPVSGFDVWLYIGAANLAVLLYALFRGWRTRFVPELLLLTLLITAYSLPNQFPLAAWVYRFVPGMDLFRSASYGLVFAKPPAILVVALMLADARTLESKGRSVLLRWAALVTFAACLIQLRRYEPLYYWDSVNYGWIAMAGSLALASVLVFLPGRYWRRWGPAVLVLVLAGEVVAHRVLFEVIFSAALAEVRPKTIEAEEIPIEPWYKWPRHLVYQPVRVPRPSLSAPYEPVGDLYHYIWTFVGIDPCVPHMRSDTYARWVEEALERRGAKALALNLGKLESLGGDFDAAFGCSQPKLTVSDPAGDARVVRFSANDLAIAVTTPAGGELVYRDAWLPDWQATLDGKRVPLARNADGFKTLEVPPGEHRVELAFRPLVGQAVLAALALLLSLSLGAQLWLAGNPPGGWPERSS